SSHPQVAPRVTGLHFICKELFRLNGPFHHKDRRRWRCCLKHGPLIFDRGSFPGSMVGPCRRYSRVTKARRMPVWLQSAPSDDGLAVSGTSAANPRDDMEELRVKLNQSLQGEDSSDGLVQSIYDAARVFELAIKEHSPVSTIPWFSKAWIGVDKNAWIKSLSYQAAVHSLLQAACEIASRGDGRDRDVNLFVQRSLLRQSAPLESVITKELSGKDQVANEWFWSQQNPVVMASYVHYFEATPRFAEATKVYASFLELTLCLDNLKSKKGVSSCDTTHDVSLLMLALSCIAAITKLGPAKISCPQFFSLIPDVTGRFMERLIDFVPIDQAYGFMRKIGLRREFLAHFGPRAAGCGDNQDKDTKEIAFWVDIAQRQLQRAIDRERIWSRLTTCESIEVLEKDLAIFGFFIALGRSTKSYLSTSGVDVKDDPVEDIIRYLIGGSILYYPQLSSISSYQLYVEVVCEELEWLQFYSNSSVASNHDHEENEWHSQGCSKKEAIVNALETCFHWFESFIKYSSWLENPSNVKAARFLSRGHQKLNRCKERLGVLKGRTSTVTTQDSGAAIQSDSLVEPNGESFEQACTSSWFSTNLENALQSVEEAVKRLEELLQELHVSSTKTGKEHLEAACSDLERIRKLKKEAEFLEASFRAKASSLQQVSYKFKTITFSQCVSAYCKEEEDALRSSVSKEAHFGNIQPSKEDNMVLNNEKDKVTKRAFHDSRRLWSFFAPRSKKTESELLATKSTVDESQESGTTITGDVKAETNDILRFELLRNELIQLEKRVQRSTSDAQNEEDEEFVNESSSEKLVAEAPSTAPTQSEKKESIIGKSIGKIKETGADVWQGTQLLAIDVAAATVLLKRVITGDEITEKEKKALQRTVTDLASVIPIGILMLLPVSIRIPMLLSFFQVTAVGHAAMLAAIQRYVPALIPSTYAPERLDLLRQLEKVKEMEHSELNADHTVEMDNLAKDPPDE
ncbi:LETM1 and EF-hand domain-containing protein anon-60Da, partial [Nymphaea thermarum]